MTVDIPFDAEVEVALATGANQGDGRESQPEELNDSKATIMTVKGQDAVLVETGASHGLTYLKWALNDDQTVLIMATGPVSRGELMKVATSLKKEAGK